MKGTLSTGRPSYYGFNTLGLFSRRFLFSGYCFLFIFHLRPRLLKQIVSVLWLHMLETTDSSLQISYSENFGVLLSEPFPQAVFEAHYYCLQMIMKYLNYTGKYREFLSFFVVLLHDLHDEI